MSDEPNRDPAVDGVRRKLLKATAAAGGALVAGVIPYEKPAVKSFFGTRSAWAQVTGPLTLDFCGELGTSPGATQDTGQDRWTFGVLVGGTSLTITAVPTDGNLDIELFLFAPGGGGLGDTNLLSGNPFGFNSGGGVGATESAMVGPLAAGTYILGIEDDRDPPSEVSGTYCVTITGDNPLGPASQVGNEISESDLKGGS